MIREEKSIDEILTFLSTHQFSDKYGTYRFVKLYWSDLRQEWNAPLEDQNGDGYDFPAKTPNAALDNVYTCISAEEFTISDLSPILEQKKPTS